MAKTVYSGTFAITAPASITITNPTSSTSVSVGDTLNITWTTTGTVGNVKIQVYKGSSSTATLTNSTANDGSYNWTIQSGDINGSGTNYKIKIFETDGSPVDYSDAFTISSEIERTASDDISISQAISKATDTWMHVFSNSDDLGISQSVSKVVDTWAHIFTIGDDISISQAVVNDDVYVYLKSNTTHLDEISISQFVGKVVDDWKHLFTNSDDLGISQSVIKSVDVWYHKIPIILDEITISQSVATSIDLWIHSVSNSDDIGISQSTTKVITGNRTAIDDIAISQVVAKVADVWFHNLTNSEDLSISQVVGKVVDVWYHRFTNGDDISIDSNAVKTAGTWRSIVVQARQDDISITSTFEYTTQDWAQVSTNIEDISLSQSVDRFVVQDDDNLRFVFGSTVIILGQKGSLLPQSNPINVRQLQKTAGAGQAKVTDYADADEFLDLKVKLNDTQKSEVISFFSNNTVYSKNPFIYLDADQTRHDVRLWDFDSIDIEKEQGGMNLLSIRMKLE